MSTPALRSDYLNCCDPTCSETASTTGIYRVSPQGQPFRGACVQHLPADPVDEKAAAYHRHRRVR